MAVHPRASGEHLPPHMVTAMAAGSSPRERGTRDCPACSRNPRRFIPARAGNTQITADLRYDTTVHPRASGEHAIPILPGDNAVGSSPRERGTRSYRSDPLEPFRFIPARAGNTAIHRARHERDSGSSPRERGTLGSARLHCQRPRFIPARAGNTLVSVGSTRAVSVHPRASGEHKTRLGVRLGGRRFIPARAGNTVPGAARIPRGTVHPRASGEHCTAPASPPAAYGSSPRERGTPDHLDRR